MTQQLQHQVEVAGDRVAVTEDDAGHVRAFFSKHSDHRQLLPSDAAAVE